MLAIGIFACRGSDRVTFPGMVQLSTITIDSVGQQQLERGTRDTLTATAKDKDGKKVTVPLAWVSSNEKVAVFERGGRLVTLDTGITIVTATSLGVVSAPVGFQVIWQGAAKIAAGSWTRPNAVNPGATITDSLRVVVTNIKGAPVANAKVAFTVTDGGGSVSPATATTGSTGIASAQWTLGPGVGTNSVAASVVRDDGTLNPLVANNLVTFTLNSYVALTIQGGDNQTAQILSDLPVAPSVRLVDSLGAPRPGVPVVFTAFQNGRVATPVVSTDANGMASPGKWTLGDIPGQQNLEARAEDARVVFRATGTGTPIRYAAASVYAGGFSTCALESNSAVTCWGQSPQNGSGGSANTSTPTAVSGSLTAVSIGRGSTHYCALKSNGEAWCWGLNALVDTSGSPTNRNAPTRLQSDLTWSQISPGFANSCAISPNQDAYCWGDNSSGQLGDGTLPPPTTRRVPGPVAGGFKFSQISSGTNHTCGLAVDGTAFCWGNNQFGQIGDGSTTTRTGPTSVSGGRTFQSIGASDGFSCALTTQGQAYCWGALFGAPQPTPVTYPSAPTFVSLSVGSGHACALAADGSAYCWGSNSFGQLGDSTTVARASPTKVAGGLAFSQVSAGYTHTCARTTGGEVACWGRNNAGELGDNTSAVRLTPRYIVLGVTP